MAFISAAKTSSGLRIRSFCANTHSSAWNRFWCCKNHRSTRVRRRFHIRSRRQCIRYSRASEHSTKDSTGVQSFSGTSILSSCRTNLGTFWAVILGSINPVCAYRWWSAGPINGTLFEGGKVVAVHEQADFKEHLLCKSFGG